MAYKLSNPKTKERDHKGTDRKLHIMQTDQRFINSSRTQIYEDIQHKKVRASQKPYLLHALSLVSLLELELLEDDELELELDEDDDDEELLLLLLLLSLAASPGIIAH